MHAAMHVYVIESQELSSTSSTPIMMIAMIMMTAVIIIIKKYSPHGRKRKKNCINK
jgi:hypothetical protein